jgi:hypothetical protein
MKNIMALVVLIAILVGCSAPMQKTISVKEIMFSDADLQQLGLSKNINEEDARLFEISSETGCRIDQSYSNIVDSSTGEYGMCAYNIRSLNNTQIIIELQKFSDYLALNGTYQYNSLHLYSSQGLLSENDYGDQSRFRVNNENDYGGQYNTPNIYFYHLWFTKGDYLIHITSKGSKDAKESISNMAHQILSKIK